ncbi:hypothetical protein L7F22_036750, partial [Adiantum nelumboides]|nr:hypothetical protein [Adiantum nelumboides]
KDVFSEEKAETDDWSFSISRCTCARPAFRTNFSFCAETSSTSFNSSYAFSLSSPCFKARPSISKSLHLARAWSLAIFRSSVSIRSRPTCLDASTLSAFKR